MAKGNEKLMDESFPKHSTMGTARMKEDKETEEGKKRGVSMERRKEGMTEKKVPMANHYQSKYNNNKHNSIIFYKIWKTTMKFN